MQTRPEAARPSRRPGEPDRSSCPVDGLPVVGLFGNDFLSNYEVDVPLRHFGLYRATGCDAAMRPFDPPFSAPAPRRR